METAFSLSDLSTMHLSLTIPTVLFLYFLLTTLSRRLLTAGGGDPPTKTQNNLLPPPPPEAGGRLPIIGHLHLLTGGAKPTHKVLGEMADKYGSIFTVRMGRQRALVVSSWPIAKECLVTVDKPFLNRPKNLAAKIMTYDIAMFGFSPYGHYWREMRKLVSLELLSAQRLRTFAPVRESEVRAATKALYDLCDGSAVAVEMKRWFADVTLNVIMRIIAGKTIGYGSVVAGDGGGGAMVGWQKSLRDFFDLLGKFTVADAVPALRWLDVGGYEKEMRKTAKELDTVVGGWLEEHKRKRVVAAAGSGGGGKVEEDFMDVILNVIGDSGGIDGRDSDVINKATCLSLTLGGSDTTTVTMSWALSLLVNHRSVLTTVQEELDRCVGRERQVQDSDLHNLTYLKAVVKETLRLYPAAPVIMRDDSDDDAVIDGRHVGKGTRLLVNLFKLQRDPAVWSPDPDDFRPERFLEGRHKDADVKGQSFELIPFSSGRRMCPGASFALQVMYLTLATVLQGFEVTTADGGPVDMTDGAGFTNLRATPLEVLLSPRLPAHLYG